MSAGQVFLPAAPLALLLIGVHPVGIGAWMHDPPGRSEQPIRTKTTFVRVDVYPTRDGQPVQGLTAADFEVRENGVLQKIDSFEHVNVPAGPGTTALPDPGSQREMLQAAANSRARLVVVFLDPAHVSLSGSHAIKEPIIHLISRVLGPEDLVGLMTPEMSASQLVLGRMTQAIEELLRRNWDWGQASDTIPPLNERKTMYTRCYPPRPNEGPLSRVAAQMISKSRERRPLDDATASLSRARGDERFRIDAAHLVDDDRLTVWIVGEIPATAGAADEFSAGATADLEIQAGDRSTSARVVLEPGERGFVTSVTLPAAAELNIRARVSGEGSTSPVTDALSIEIGSKTARPLVFRKGPSTGNRVQPTADLRFTRAERISVELPVAGAAGPGAARLLDRRGTPLRVSVRVGERIDETGQRWITGELALAPLAAGDYAIEQAPEGLQKVFTAIRITR